MLERMLDVYHKVSVSLAQCQSFCCHICTSSSLRGRTFSGGCRKSNLWHQPLQTQICISHIVGEFFVSGVPFTNSPPDFWLMSVTAGTEMGEGSATLITTFTVLLIPLHSAVCQVHLQHRICLALMTAFFVYASTPNCLLHQREEYHHNLMICLPPAVLSRPVNGSQQLTPPWELLTNISIQIKLDFASPPQQVGCKLYSFQSPISLRSLSKRCLL